MGPRAVGRAALADAATTSCDGIVIGALAPDVCVGLGAAVGIGAIGAVTRAGTTAGTVAGPLVITGTVMLCVYGSIGRISPDGPRDDDTTSIEAVANEPIAGSSYGSIGAAGPDGPVPRLRLLGRCCVIAASAMDAGDDDAGSVDERSARSGATIHRPAAKPAAPPAMSHSAVPIGLSSLDMTCSL